METSQGSTTDTTGETRTLDRPRIVSTPGTCGGRPRIDGHRITVEDIAIWHERMGLSPDEIVADYPTITLSDVHAALAYYYDHRAEIDAELEQGKRFVAELKAKAAPSRLQESLKARRAKASEDSLPS